MSKFVLESPMKLSKHTLLHYPKKVFMKLQNSINTNTNIRKTATHSRQTLFNADSIYYKTGILVASKNPTASRESVNRSKAVVIGGSYSRTRGNAVQDPAGTPPSYSNGFGIARVRPVAGPLP